MNVPVYYENRCSRVTITYFRAMLREKIRIKITRECWNLHLLIELTAVEFWSEVQGRGPA